MISYISQVMTLANGIIGVSVLAMPYCFKQCGIVLAILVLILCSFLSRLACHFLIKSAVMSRRRNYEFLAFHAFGLMGKLSVELFIIGFLFGSCIALFVVNGDLGSQIIGKMINKNPESIRISFMLITGILIVLPLGLLKNIDSLASVSTAAIGFYLCLVLKIIGESMGHIFRGDWYENVNFWRPAGILQCLPIVSMALFCQTQLFEIYESVPNVSLEKMNTIVKGAINFCTVVYLFIGFFGYIAFCTQPFSGNILMSLENSLTSDIIKIGFVMSVIFSFPLCIFPCRASLNSLFFRAVQLHDGPSSYIPIIRFRFLTLIIVVGSMIIGILMPNIEFVLGFVGSTIGVMICLIYPAGFFIAISTKNTNERLLAQIILFIGIWIMILGSYANLYSVQESSTSKVLITTDRQIIQINNIPLNSLNENRPLIIKASEINSEEKANLLIQKKKEELNVKSRIKYNKSLSVKEPENVEKVINNVEKLPILINATSKPDIKIESVRNEFINLNENKIVDVKVPDKLNNEVQQPVVVVLTAEEKMKAIEQEKIDQQQLNDNLINSDAIKTKELEIAAEQAEDEVSKRIKEEERIKNTLQQHRIEALQLMKEQKDILQNLKKRKEEFEKDKEQLKDLESNNKKEDENKLNADTVQVKKEMMNSSNVKTRESLDLNENKETKINGSLSSSPSNVPVPSVKSRGSILTLLTNSVAQSSNLNLSLNNNDNINNQSSLNAEIKLPIPLKLINQTKDKIIINNDIDKILPVQRDILEKHSVEKRDVNESLKENIIDDRNKKQINIIAINNSTANSTINNNSNVDNNKENSLSSDLIGENEYLIVKKRDLKSWKDFTSIINNS